jgi:hypothetical protein
MKQIALSGLVVLAGCAAAWGQNTDPWPSSGPVGIGTSSPVSWSMLDLKRTGTLSISGGAGSFATATGTTQAAIITSEEGGLPLVLKARAGSVPDLLVSPLGNVGIGTATPGYKLDVAGSIGATDIYVTSNALPDYVFDADYKNAPLPEVAAYIEQNHHLPGMPSAAEAERNGLSVGEMQNKLLQKVEELTLHMIAAEKRNKELKRQVRELRAQFQARVGATEARDRGGKK